MREFVVSFAERDDVFMVTGEGEMGSVVDDVVRVFAVRISTGVFMFGEELAFLFCLDVAGFEVRNSPGTVFFG